MKKHIEHFKSSYLPTETQTQDTNKMQSFASRIKTDSCNRTFMSMFEKSPLTFYLEMCEYFGDSLTLRLPELHELKNNVFKPAPKEVKPLMSDFESGKSGEELLAELEAQVKQEENERKIKKEDRFKKVSLQL